MKDRGRDCNIHGGLRGNHCDLISRILNFTRMLRIQVIFLNIQCLSLQKYIQFGGRSQHVELESAVISA